MTAPLLALAEQVEKPSLTDKVEARFRRSPNVWIDAHEFLTIGGFAAWRTRIAECRKRGMDIRNETHRDGGYTQ